jgi:hypothetical protein
MTLREPNSELHWASTRPEDNTPRDSRGRRPLRSSRLVPFRVQLSEPDDELARKVLVKQQLHRATRLPTRAANSYTARKSSGSSSG